MSIHLEQESRARFVNIIEQCSSSPQGRLPRLKAACLDTPLGSLLAIGDETHLHLLEFLDNHGLEQELGKLIRDTQSAISLGMPPPVTAIEKELKAYFEGRLKVFETPFYLHCEF